MLKTPSRRFSRVVIAPIALAGSMLMTGCIGQGDYDKLYETNRSLEARNARLEQDLRQAQQSLELLRGSMGRGEGALSELTSQNAELRRQLDQALADYRALEQRLSGMQFGPLDAETDAALKELAARYPDLIRYDSERGMLRFASDLTFDSGSAVVKAEAGQALQALAQILGSDAASKYEIIIEGHTDSQRISAGTAQRHPTNRHLSAHRAIAVIDELGRMNVPSSRMMAAGWGEHRPLVPNTPSGNTPQNRRVEIYLAQSRGTAAANAPANSGSSSMEPSREVPPTRQPDFSK